MFAPEATIQSGSKWDFQVTLTGPVIDPTFLILLTSSDPTSVPVVAATELTAGQTSGAFLGGVATSSRTSAGFLNGRNSPRVTASGTEKA